MTNTLKRHWPKFLLLIPLALIVWSVLPGSTGSQMHHPSPLLPEYVHNSPVPHAVTAYTFAVEHPEDLQHQPCYCGCNRIGHTSSLDCFVAGVDTVGEVIFDQHGSYCGICVDITMDVIKLKEQGKTPLEIRRYVDATYSYIGPGTDTPLPTY